MQGLNSLLNSSQISLQDLHNTHQHQQIQDSQMHHQLHHPATAHYDPSSNDDFLEQVLYTLPSCSWPDLNPSSSPKHLREINRNNSVHFNGASNVKSTEDYLSDDTTAPSNTENAFFQFDEQASLATKFRNNQISSSSTNGRSHAAAAAAAAEAALLLRQQLLMSSGIASAGVVGSNGHGADSGLLQMPLSLDGGGEFDRLRNDGVDGPSYRSPNPVGDGSVQALFNGFNGSLHANPQASNQAQQFHNHHPQGAGVMQGQTYGGTGTVSGETLVTVSAGGEPSHPKSRVRARRGHATDPHSIAERLRRERIAERMKGLQELVPNANKTDKASMLDEIIDYVKFLQLQVKVLSMSRLGGAAAVAPLVADMSCEGGSDCIQTNGTGGSLGRKSNGNQTAVSSNTGTLTMTEQQVAKLMEEDMGSAMQYLQGKGLCLMPISLATAISTVTCHSRNSLINNGQISNHVIASNGEGISSPNMSVMTVHSVNLINGVGDSSAKDTTSVSKP